MSLAESIQKRINPLFPGLLGIEIVEAGPDRIVARMKVRADLCTAGNTLHGGFPLSISLYNRSECGVFSGNIPITTGIRRYRRVHHLRGELLIARLYLS